MKDPRPFRWIETHPLFFFIVQPIRCDPNTYPRSRTCWWIATTRVLLHECKRSQRFDLISTRIIEQEERVFLRYDAFYHRCSIHHQRSIRPTDSKNSWFLEKRKNDSYEETRNDSRTKAWKRSIPCCFSWDVLYFLVSNRTIVPDRQQSVHGSIRYVLRTRSDLEHER